MSGAPAAIDCVVTCSGLFGQDGLVTFTAQATPGSFFPDGRCHAQRHSLVQRNLSLAVAPTLTVS